MTPTPLPIEARRAAWARLWAVLLAPPPPPPSNEAPAGDEPAGAEGGR